LSNRTGDRACTFTLIDNAYGAKAARYRVDAGRTMRLVWPVTASHGWYDVSVTGDGGAPFLRRLAGYVDLGGVCVTDPAIGRNRGRLREVD
jgi:phospholipase C